MAKSLIVEPMVGGTVDYGLYTDLGFLFFGMNVFSMTDVVYTYDKDYDNARTVLLGEEI